jgi:hypothetical protein
MAEGEGVRRGGEDGPLGPKGQGGGLSGFFGFSFYSEFLICFLLFFSLLNSNPTKPQIQI